MTFKADFRGSSFISFCLLFCCQLISNGNGFDDAGTSLTPLFTYQFVDYSFVKFGPLFVMLSMQFTILSKCATFGIRGDLCCAKVKIWEFNLW